MKQFILNQYDEMPKEALITLMKSLDTDTFFDVMTTIKPQNKDGRREPFTTYYCFFDWKDESERKLGVVLSAAKFGIPPSNDHRKPIIFGIKGQVPPAGTTVWLEYSPGAYCLRQ
uniref:Uncharacterized protein n=1 Tax=viral metagenome TaxID=1070528 RepID=A0A6C0CGY5_9ZZZZ